jgi:uncharacterized membrane protein YhaH (DUF805 family)
MNMEKTRNILMMCFWWWLSVAIIIVVLYEGELLETGMLTEDTSMEFVLTTLMELLSLAAIFVGLRMFKKKRIHDDLTTRKALALRFWGLVRLCIIGLPLSLNVLFYYLFMNTTFGYMAIIMALCLPFVYPTLNRCLTETEE